MEKTYAINLTDDELGFLEEILTDYEESLAAYNIREKVVRQLVDNLMVTMREDDC